MGFVEYNNVIVGKYPVETHFAYRKIREKEVMVNHYYLRVLGFLPEPADKTVRQAGAFLRRTEITG